MNAFVHFTIRYLSLFSMGTNKYEWKSNIKLRCLTSYIFGSVTCCLLVPLTIVLSAILITVDEYFFAICKLFVVYSTFKSIEIDIFETTLCDWCDVWQSSWMEVQYKIKVSHQLHIRPTVSQLTGYSIQHYVFVYKQTFQNTAMTRSTQNHNSNGQHGGKLNREVAGLSKTHTSGPAYLSISPEFWVHHDF
jgi:hypothetical protein